MTRHQRCCGCIPYRFATFLGGLLLGALGAAGCYFYFTNTDLPNRSFTVGGISVTPLSSGQPVWYYAAAVSILAAAVGVFGMISALSANRRLVKAFEAFYVLSLLTQFGLIVWGLIFCMQNRSSFDSVCTASKDGLVDLPVPGFASDWSCQKIFMAGVLTIGVGGIIWLGFNFYMTNRVIRYARELFEDKANRYKVLSEAATKELDREQQIPLNYTNVGRSMNDEVPHGGQLPQPSYRDEIEYKDPRHDADPYQHSHAAPAGFGSFGHDLSQQHQSQNQHPVAPGFRRDSNNGLDLVNPGYGEQEVTPIAPVTSAPETMTSAPYVPVSHTSDTTPSAPYHAPGSGQSFVHASTSKIPSPFEDDEPVAQPTSSHQDDSKAP